MEWYYNIRESSLDSYWDYDYADEGDDYQCNDYLHLAIAAVHFPFDSSRACLEHLGIFWMEKVVPFKLVAFWCSPSRLTWLSINLRVLSDMSSLIWIFKAVHRWSSSWHIQPYLKSLHYCISRISRATSLLSAISGLTSYRDTYIRLIGVVSNCGQVGSQLAYRRIDVSLGIVIDAECQVEKSFIILLAEPHSVLGLDPLALLLVEFQFLKSENDLNQLLDTFGTSGLSSSSRALSRVRL